MKKMSLFLMVLTASVMLTGCETLKSTISGPFIGLEKDMQNLAKMGNNPESAPESTCASSTKQSELQAADAWMQKNLW